MRVLSIALAFFAFFKTARCGDNAHSNNLRANKHKVRAALSEDVAIQHNTLEKRYENARFTYYAAGLGACGGYNTDNDFVSFFFYAC